MSLQEYYINKMSEASKIIYNGTKFSSRKIKPSFKNTDEVLMKSAKKTYSK